MNESVDLIPVPWNSILLNVNPSIQKDGTSR
jgi:hypothetical protein